MRDIKLIFGKTGSGKTVLARSFINKLQRVIIIDAMLEYEGLVFNTFLDLYNYHSENYPDSFRYVCRFTNDTDIEYVFKWCFLIGNLTLVVEEAEIYINPYSSQSDFLYLVRYGRHNNISLIGIARRMTELSPDFRAMVNSIYSFKQTEPIDIKRAESNGLYGLEKLEPFDYIKYNGMPVENLHYKVIHP